MHLGVGDSVILTFPKREGRVGNPQLNALKSTGVGCRFLEICSQIDFLEIA
jgi:hypothetical protein